MNTEFFERFPTTEELAAHIAAHPEEYGAVSVSQFIKDHLPKEATFQTKIIKALQVWRDAGAIDRRSVIWKQSAGVYNRNGMPDVMAVIEGRLFGFEIKRPYIGKATALQQKTIRELNSAGASAAVICYPEEAQRLIIAAGLWRGGTPAA